MMGRYEDSISSIEKSINHYSINLKGVEYYKDLYQSVLIYIKADKYDDGRDAICKA